MAVPYVQAQHWWLLQTPTLRLRLPDLCASSYDHAAATCNIAFSYRTLPDSWTGAELIEQPELSTKLVYEMSPKLLALLTPFGPSYGNPNRQAAACSRVASLCGLEIMGLRLALRASLYPTALGRSD